jgi:hypothetical protein
MVDNLLLLPSPRRLVWTGETYTLPRSGFIVLDGPDVQGLRFTAISLKNALRDRVGLDWELAARTSGTAEQGLVVLSIVPGSVGHVQGYELTITPGRVQVVSNALAGIFYAVQTLVQILQQSGQELPTLRCSDWPDFPSRGVMLDISRDKVPTMKTLFELVDRLASWKINQFQLYTEHAFAYREHPIVWSEASPITGEEILALDAYCRQRFVELVPNQNSFGHMRRWLIHDEYRHLAECPQGFDTDLGHFDEPFTLAPAEPGSLNLLQGLYDELLPHFSSRLFNVGCDETFDLGQGRSKELVAERGVGRVYLDFLLQIYRQVKARGHIMMFWGDIVMKHPELVPELPRDLIALEWGYEADHDFDDHGAIFAQSGLHFYVCPGTSSWNSIAGRTYNALGNLRNAAENGRKHGAVGFLNTDWGDNGHWQPLPISYLGLAYGAAVSWAEEANRDIDISAAISAYAFQDRGEIMGQLAYELGNVHEAAQIPRPNATILFRILQANPEEIAAYAASAEEAAAIGDRLRITLNRIDEAITRLPDNQMEGPDATLIGREFSWTANMQRHACQRAIWALDKYHHREDEALRQYLAADTRALMAEHKAIWHARNRTGGFCDSQARLEKMARLYL